MNWITTWKSFALSDIVKYTVDNEHILNGKKHKFYQEEMRHKYMVKDIKNQRAKVNERF